MEDIVTIESPISIDIDHAQSLLRLFDGGELQDYWNSFVVEQFLELQKFHASNQAEPSEKHFAILARITPNQVVGFLHYYQTHCAGVWEVMGLAVMPTRRRQELGSRLLEAGLSNIIATEPNAVQFHFKSPEADGGKFHQLARAAWAKTPSVTFLICTGQRNERLSLASNNSFKPMPLRGTA